MKTNNLISNLQNNIQKSENGKIFFLPSTDFSIFNNSENLHFVGFGGAGSNTIEYLHAKGIKAKFTCISNPVRANISDEIDFIHYIYQSIFIYNLYRIVILMQVETNADYPCPITK